MLTIQKKEMLGVYTLHTDDGANFNYWDWNWNWK